MTTVVCTVCGARSEGSAKFCGQCGASITSAATSVTTGGPATAPAQPTPPPVGSPTVRPPTSTHKPFSWAPVLILLAGMGALAAVLFLIRPGGQPPAGEVLAPPTLGPAGAGTIQSEQAPPSRSTAVTPAPAVAAPTPAPPAAAVAAEGSSVPGTEAMVTQKPVVEEKPAEPTFEAVYRGRKKCKFDVDPEDAEVYINGKHLGKADDWDGMGGGKEYEFESSGPFYATFKLKGFRTATVKIVPDEDVEEKTVSVDFKMKKDSDKGDKDDEEKDAKKDKKKVKDKDKDKDQDKDKDKDDDES